MAFGNKTSDATLLKNVLRKLTQKCTVGTRIGATVRGGDATVTGTIKHEHERKPIIRCVSAVQGIGRVIDQLQLQKKPNC